MNILLSYKKFENRDRSGSPVTGKSERNSIRLLSTGDFKFSLPYLAFGFRHETIEAGIAALQKMAEEKGFEVSFTEDAMQFTTANLRQFNMVVFLNTTGDVLNAGQQEAFERYIQAGGGYVGVHAATDTEYDWPWYGRLAGAFFLDDPNVQTGKMVVRKKITGPRKECPMNSKKLMSSTVLGIYRRISRWS